MRLLLSMKVVTPDTIRRTLSKLPRDLNETYRRIFEGIDDDLCEKALLALKWIVLAPRLQFIEELVEACAFRAGSLPDLQSETSRSQAYNLFELLQDLIIIEPNIPADSYSHSVKYGTHVVTLAHFSLTEYLTRPLEVTVGAQTFHFQVSDGHILIARSCLSFLFHFNMPGIGAGKHPLLPYTWNHWEKHIPIATPESSQCSRIRTDALRFYKHIQILAQSAHSSSERTELLRVLDWVPDNYVDASPTHLVQHTSILHTPQSTTRTVACRKYTSLWMCTKRRFD
jgi:hypothetical protein